MPAASRNGRRLVGHAERIKSGLPEAGSDKALKTGLIAAGGLARILTAGSAGISSLRRQREGAHDGASS